jgi:hypothetical protein
MANYTPDNWVVIKLKGDDPHYRILAGWSGGYTTSDTWRMNSGITRVDETEYAFLFYGASGSCYEGRKTAYCLRKNNAYVWAQLQELHGDKVEIMPEATDWLSMDWIIR